VIVDIELLETKQLVVCWYRWQQLAISNCYQHSV